MKNNYTPSREQNEETKKMIFVNKPSITLYTINIRYFFFVSEKVQVTIFIKFQIMNNSTL